MARQLRHVREELRRIGEARVGQEVGATDRFRHGRQLVRRDDEHEPGAIGGPVYVQRRIGRILAIVRREKLRVAQRRLDRDARRPDALGEQRGRDIRSLAGALATIERRDDRRIEADRGGIVAAPGHRPGRRCAGIARHRQQAAARPVRRDVEARELGVRPLLAEARDIRIDQARIPLHDVVIFELQSLARGMRGVDDEHVGPFDELLEHLLGARRFQIERHAALVAVGEVPGIGILRLRLRRDLDAHVSRGRRSAAPP